MLELLAKGETAFTMERTEIRGLWWLPQFPEHKVAGVLDFHPKKGAVLKSIGGNFNEPLIDARESEKSKEFIELPTLMQQDLILGFDELGEPVTLYMCKLGNILAETYQSTSISARAVFVGCHFDDISDISFDSLEVQFTFLEEWIGASGLSVQNNFSPDAKFVGTQISYSPPKVNEINISGYKIVFYHSYNLSQKVDLVNARKYTSIELIPNSPLHFDDYRKGILLHLRNFLNLALGVAILPLSVIGRNKLFPPTRRDDKHQPRPIRVLYVPDGARLTRADTSAYTNLLFKYETIANHFGECFETWMQKSTRLGPVLDLYFGMYYISTMYASVAFLTLAQALEVYHRQMIGGDYLTPEQYEAVWETLKDAIPDWVQDNHRKSLIGSLEHGYSLSLRSRVKQLLRDELAPYEHIINRIVGNRKSFVNQLVDTRNYLTHYSEKPGAKPITDAREQSEFARKIQRILQLCFLVEMGLPEDIIKAIMSR